MRKSCSLRDVISVTLVGLACFHAAKVLADCSAEGCDDEGSISAGCGTGANACPQDSQSACEGDTARQLHSGQFECGAKDGRCNCHTSDEDQDKCYTDYDSCDWDDDRTPKCGPDGDSSDPHYNWVKVADACDD